MPAAIKDFLSVLVGTASLLGAAYIGLTLTLGHTWIEANAAMVFVNGLYLLLIPPLVWMVRYRPESQAGFRSPKVRVILDDGMIITEPCEWMAYRTVVSVFKFQDDVEQFVLSAYVFNIQSNNLVQIHPSPAFSDHINVETLREIKEKMLIKPGHMHE